MLSSCVSQDGCARRLVVYKVARLCVREVVGVFSRVRDWVVGMMVAVVMLQQVQLVYYYCTSVYLVASEQIQRQRIVAAILTALSTEQCHQPDNSATTWFW